MIPLTLTDDVQRTLLGYLTTTFNFQDDDLEAALVAFLTQADGGMFQGPYMQLRLPFAKVGETAASTANGGQYLDIAPPFTPYVHQVAAFARLTSKAGHEPQPTIITTGTGSGKTECFLYPILDHCYRVREAAGIKAIILYPMNALATDQARRLAGLIWGDERLRGVVTAGLYVGGEGESAYMAMGPDQLIDSRTALRENPPDILLTNYKMLDFLLLRPEDKPLWADNGPETLRYLVLDELHTYDGAQGSDVACLIRRLRARLGIAPGGLCPVGTSATVVSEAGNTVTKLTAFAAQIFGVEFPLESVIGEVRVGLRAFLPDEPSLLALPEAVAALAERPGESYEGYLQRQMAGWWGEALSPLALGERLKAHGFLRALLQVMGDGVLSVTAVCAALTRQDAAFAQLTAEEQRLVLLSFLAMVAYARREDGGWERPFLTLQAQLWVREMSRLMRRVSQTADFFWRDDMPPGSSWRGLPAYFCRECGHGGWLTFRREGDEAVSEDTQQIYRHYYDRHKNMLYLYPAK
ncbi:MAG: DEAD/DEAH box helicase [Ardenticatenaceae bacterium]|nr:DEAD/DEAH box helicase [Ardenticatenaceae bacterium]